MIKFDYKTGKRQGQIICDSDILATIRNHFSVANKEKKFAPELKKRFLKDRKYAITPTGLFSFGFYHEILKYLRDEQITDIELTDEFKARCKCGFENSEFVGDLTFDPRYFQQETVEKSIKRGMGTIVIGTGGGKSLTQAFLIENLKKHLPWNPKVLILVPGLTLVYQLQDDFKSYGVRFDYSGWTGEVDTKKNPISPLQDTSVVICNNENFTAKFIDNPWIVDVDLLIVDECHKVNNNSNITKLISKIKTPNRFGFTGSLSDNKLDQWKTIGTFGPIVYEKKSKELRDEGFLTDVVVTALQLNHPNKSNTDYKTELDYLYNSEKRNAFISKVADKMTGNVLIMVNHLIHGENLMDAAKKITDKKVFFVKGEVAVDNRKKIITLMEGRDDIVCIAMSSIFSTGINVKNIPNIVFAGLGKSFIRVVQSIGRGLRLHDNKDRLNIFDIFDNLKYSTTHSEKRRLIYDKEEIKYRLKEIDL